MILVPVVILGAARSGTNMLRDALVTLPAFGTWPCDELPFLWRYGNRDRPDDEFERDDATARTARYIRREFTRLARRRGVRYVVEKTCANTLRAGFVDAVLPEARFVVLVRDGRDVTVSAAKRWTAPFDVRYAARKARYVPRRDLTPYLWRAVRNRLHQRRDPDRRLGTWGPRCAGLDAEGGLDERCARQWRRCVERTESGLAEVDPARVLRLRYEHLVADPAAELTAVARWLRAPVAPQRCAAAGAAVSDRSVGRWRSCLDDAALHRLEPILRPPLEDLGYRWS